MSRIINTVIANLPSSDRLLLCVQTGVWISALLVLTLDLLFYRG